MKKIICFIFNHKTPFIEVGKLTVLCSRCGKTLIWNPFKNAWTKYEM